MCFPVFYYFVAVKSESRYIMYMCDLNANTHRVINQLGVHGWQPLLPPNAATATLGTDAGSRLRPRTMPLRPSAAATDAEFCDVDDLSEIQFSAAAVVTVREAQFPTKVVVDLADVLAPHVVIAFYSRGAKLPML